MIHCEMAETVDTRGERIDYLVPRGADFVETLELRDSSGPLDMADYSARFRVWGQGESSATEPATLTEGSGSVQIRLTPAELAELPSRCTYDCALIDGDGVVIPVSWGEFQLTGVN